ncbi:MAG: hypothetical protein IJD78_06395 [Clostridia bacterium]|nr:hypothetical protein [Clostridia bacterium]
MITWRTGGEVDTEAVFQSILGIANRVLEKSEGRGAVFPFNGKRAVKNLRFLLPV